VTDAGPGPEPLPRGALRWWKEVVYIVVLYFVYSLVRNSFGSSGGGDVVDPVAAFNHAKAVITIQDRMGLYFEPELQQWYLSLPGRGGIRFWNIFYGTAHFLVTAGALVWCYRARPDIYPKWRNTLAFTTLCALIGFASFSLMPPRLMDSPGEYGGCQVYAPEAAAGAGEDALTAPGCDEFGFVDTLAVDGGWLSFGQEGVEDVSNQWAAMPSMHIGWSVWSMLVLLQLVRRHSVRVLVVLYPFATLFTILVTANHFWIDAIGGLVALGAGYLISTEIVPRLFARGSAAPR
jgi:hypothetical protein